LRNNVKGVFALSDNDLILESASSEIPEDESNQIDTVQELEQVRVKVLDLEASLAEKDGEITRADTRISELEQVVSELGDKLGQAVSSYRTLAVETNSQVPEELITGATVEEISASLERAINLVSRVKQELESEIASSRVPIGSPERTPINLEALSPREKIEYAIGGRR